MPTVSAPPNLWDTSGDAQAKKLESITPVRGSWSANDLGALANQARNPGAQAQLGSLQQYQAQALGLAGPSLAEQQLLQQGQQQAAQTVGMGARSRGGNLTGMQQQAMAAQMYGGQQLNAQQAQLQAAERAQAAAAAAQLGGQMYGQGLGYDQLATQGLLGADANNLGWYAAQRGMDLQQDAASRAFAMGLIQSGAGFVGGLTGAAGQVAGG